MVGAVGRGENPSEINLSAMHGDIRIIAIAGVQQPKQAEPAAGPVHTEAAVEPVQSSAGNTSSGADPKLAILESLSKGEITVDEAARLLERAS
jgi:hypothetical protein